MYSRRYLAKSLNRFHPTSTSSTAKFHTTCCQFGWSILSESITELTMRSLQHVTDSSFENHKEPSNRLLWSKEWLKSELTKQNVWPKCTNHASSEQQQKNQHDWLLCSFSLSAQPNSQNWVCFSHYSHSTFNKLHFHCLKNTATKASLFFSTTQGFHYHWRSIRAEKVQITNKNSRLKGISGCKTSWATWDLE